MTDLLTGLLELREKIKLYYSKFEMVIIPVAKFLLAFITLNTLNQRMGYMPQLDNVSIVLIVSLLCSFLPLGALVLFASLFSVLHMYALSMEVALVGLCFLLILYLLYFRFGPAGSTVAAVTPLLCALKIPYAVPVVVGLTCAPATVVSMGCGLGAYYLLDTVVKNASNIKTMGDEAAIEKIRLIVDSFLGNRAMLVVIASFVITALVVYFIRRMSIDYAWTIAMVSGAMVNVIILLIGDLLYDTNISVGGALLGSLLAIVIAKAIEFFRFCVDYSRTEKVQFEDDEYYYYVKAVPKMSVAMSTKTVKRINTQQGVRPVERHVVTERTAPGRNGYGAAPHPQNRNADYRGGKSVTIGNAEAAKTAPAAPENTEIEDDYEELF